ncbi:MAG TPA: MFS transporter [Candidatus Limnocylindrales bacterium]|nr:MFS transporter [Candidatus Limnocylindrales bacterium]
MQLLRSPRGAAARLGSAGFPILILAVVAFASQVGVAVMLPLLPLYAIELGADPFVLGLLTSAFAVTNAVGQLGGGFLADRFGARGLVPGGWAVYAACNLLIATAAAALPLIAYRSLAGLGAGVALSAERIYLAGIVDETVLAFANGILSAAGSAGALLGPAVGGLIAAVSDLRMPFLLVGATSAVGVVVALRFLPPERGREAARSHDSADAAGPSAAAPVAVPTSPRSALAVLVVSNLAFSAAFGGFITTYSPYATARLGWSTTDIGILFSLFGLGNILIGPWLARRGDERGRATWAVLSCIPVALYTAVFVSDLPQPVIYAAGVIAGGGVAGFGANWYAMLATVAGAERRGRRIGSVMAFSNLGLVVGAMGASAVWEGIDLRVAAVSPLVSVLVAAGTLLVLPQSAGMPRPRPAAAA